MTANAEILDAREPVKGPFIAAIALHASVVVAAVVYPMLGGRTDRFGAPDAGGLAVGIEVAKSIPLPHEGQPNPLANDTKSEVPQEKTKPQERVKEVKPPPDAVKLK